MGMITKLTVMLGVLALIIALIVRGFTIELIETIKAVRLSQYTKLMVTLLVILGLIIFK